MSFVPPSSLTTTEQQQRRRQQSLSEIRKSIIHHSQDITFVPPVNDELFSSKEEQHVYEFLQGLSTTTKEQIALNIINGDFDNNNENETDDIVSSTSSPTTTTTKPSIKKTKKQQQQELTFIPDLSQDEQQVYNFISGLSTAQKHRIALSFIRKEEREGDGNDDDDEVDVLRMIRKLSSSNILQDNESSSSSSFVQDFTTIASEE